MYSSEKHVHEIYTLLGCVHIEIYGIRYLLYAIRYTGTAVHIEVACSFRVYEKSCEFGTLKRYEFLRRRILCFAFTSRGGGGGNT